MARYLRRALGTLATLGALLLIPSTASAAVTLGVQTDDLSTFSTVSVQGGNIFATLEDPRPGIVVTAPTDGVLTSWRTYEFSGTATAALVVLRRTTGDNMRLISVGRPQTAMTSWFGGPERLSIQAGDYIGVVLLSQSFSYFFWGQNATGGRYGYYNNLVPGGPAQPPKDNGGGSPMVTSGAVFNLRAELELDADQDGWGDETQDNCPAVAGDDQTDSDGDGAGDICDADDDNDGLPDGDESAHHTNPLVADTDGDGLNDGDEVDGHTDPLAADTDSDGIDDGSEVALGLNANDADTDDDSFTDGADGCPTTAGTDGGCKAAPAPPAPPAADTAPTVGFASPAEGDSVSAGQTIDVLLDAADDKGVTSVEVMTGGKSLCQVAAAPYTCQIPAGGDLVGTRTLVAVARDAAGNVGLATRTIRVKRFRGATVRTSVRVAAGPPKRLTVAGKVRLPEGLDPATGCRGRVAVTVRRGTDTVGSRRVPVDSSCGYRATLDLKPGANRGDRFSVRVRFEGNAALRWSPKVRRMVAVRTIPEAKPRPATERRLHRSAAG
jgi:Bacterial Ig domain/Bacterial TSP3 repeat